MAIELFGLTAADVLAELPSNTRGVTSSSEGLNTAKIEAWIRGGCGELQALMERAGIDPALAAVEGSASREVARNGVIAFALAKALSKGMNPADPRITTAWEEWRSAKSTLTKVPSSVGDVKPPKTGTHTNVNLDPARQRRLTFRYKRW